MCAAGPNTESIDNLRQENALNALLWLSDYPVSQQKNVNNEKNVEMCYFTKELLLSKYVSFSLI